MKKIYQNHANEQPNINRILNQIMLCQYDRKKESLLSDDCKKVIRWEMSQVWSTYQLVIFGISSDELKYVILKINDLPPHSWKYTSYFYMYICIHREKHFFVADVTTDRYPNPSNPRNSNWSSKKTNTN